MASILGFPRIGKNRELKKALEDFWAKKIDEAALQNVAKTLRAEHWATQKGLDFVSVNDFSLYDNMLDLSVAIGAIPARFRASGKSGLELYFGLARGLESAPACEMTKWFNTNYHFVVPELSIDDDYKVDASGIIAQYNEAKALGFAPKIQLIGLFTFFGLSNIVKGAPDEVFRKVKSAYLDLVDVLADTLGSADSKVLVEFSEPIFARGIDPILGSFGCKKKTMGAIECIYDNLAKRTKAIVSTFFEHSCEFSEILLRTKAHTIGLDFVFGAKNLESLDAIAASDKNLQIGIINGRNIWRADLESALDFCEKIAAKIPKNRLTIASSCSLLHTPFSKAGETKMDAEILSWQSYATEKIDEILLLEAVFKNGVTEATKAAWEEAKATNLARKNSSKIHNPALQSRLKSALPTSREMDFVERAEIQRREIGYGDLATTTIGSFPQTPELRTLRAKFKKGEIDKSAYESGVKGYIKDCVAFQEEIGLDVLVHGEPERNDMVEYFGEQMEGFVFSQNAWVQSYGSRCVKPPIIFGDVVRPRAMTLEWSKYAQSLTKKPMKGMLTGPVTILNWSFVRDDVPRSAVCRQLSLAIRDEISDLQNDGIRIIQVDEAAFKEGYPLRAEDVKSYESWALECFKIATAVAKPSTQIHTHMCYSEFNDIIKTIEAMDADVISIECARSGNALLKIFKDIGYTHEIGPGVYDIHSPRIPSVAEIEAQIRLLLEVLPKSQLWINPDCGLKTRKWEEVKPALKNMIDAVARVKNG